MSRVMSRDRTESDSTPDPTWLIEIEEVLGFVV